MEVSILYDNLGKGI